MSNNTTGAERRKFKLLFYHASRRRPEKIPIWPNDSVADKEAYRIGPGDAIRRKIDVTRPTANGAAVVILQGGGFRHLVIDKEGHEVGKWLNTIGVAGFVVRYRVALQSNADQATDFGFPAELHIFARGGHGFGLLV